MRKPLADLSVGFLPAIVLLKNKQAGLLLAWTEDGSAQFSLPKMAMQPPR
jgi:hypothetical protein